LFEEVEGGPKHYLELVGAFHKLKAETTPENFKAF